MVTPTKYELNRISGVSANAGRSMEQTGVGKWREFSGAWPKVITLWMPVMGQATTFELILIYKCTEIVRPVRGQEAAHI